jgi:hypothetical protein
MAKFEQDKAMHIFDHILEWRKTKILIKAMVPPYFLLEWFLKSLLMYILKDVVTLGVFLEEQAIFRVQYLYIIYSQSRILYDIMLDAPWSDLNLEKPNSNPHVDGIVGYAQTNVTDLDTSQMQKLVIQQPVAGSTYGLTT